MNGKDFPVKQARLPESAHIWDSSDHQFVVAYRKDFKRQKTIILIDARTFNASLTSLNGALFEVGAYAKGLLLIDLDVTGAPTDILFSLEFSADRINWYKYMIGPFGDLRYEDSAGDKTECLDFPILAPFMRLKAVATGTDASKTFLITAKAIING
jgi:hypothetical protein